ncbi:MAB_1171c family putative transporter [Nocardia brasiliensis]|uniref:MAB_1171c family putative transporter n=1 Tax=Nocardia brasiliensis TaxID=37326 RepID=UPI002455FC0B|nr:MAB_1171c family putative transporter [Nocardia brasiliensis]
MAVGRDLQSAPMNSAPPVFTTIIVVLVLGVICGRWFLVNETLTDRLINRALTWDVSAVSAYAFVAGIGYPDLAQRVFLAVGFLALSNAFGFVVTLGGRDLRKGWRRQRRYDTIATLAGFVVACCAAVNEMAWFPAVLPAVDWDGVLWMAVDACLVVIAGLLGRACIRDLRIPGATTREKSTYCALLAVALYTAIASVYRSLCTLSGVSPQHMSAGWAVGSFTVLAILAMLISIPLVDAVLIHAGLDRAGRCCRQLRPMWHDLTTAVPEVVLPLAHTEHPGSNARLYRMTVEIRDALLHLKQFVPDPETGETPDLGTYARGIAEATRQKLHGMPPSYPRHAVRFPAGDRTTELRNLLALSREWASARVVLAGGRLAS